MRKNFVICLSLISAIAFMTGCKGNKKSKAEETEEVTSVLVKTKKAVFEDIEHSAEFTSNIEPYKENNIAPSMSVRIDQIFVDVGANVRKGQLLVRMDPTQYNQSNVQLTNLKADYDRLKAVYDAGGISKQQLDQAETALSVQLEQTNNLKDNIELRSPIDGVVTARNYDPGDMYSIDPILQVMQINTLKVTASVSEQYFPYIKTGMPAEIRVDMYSGRVFEGKVTLIHPAIDVATRTFNVEISIPNAKAELRPGMFSRTKLHFGTTRGIMVEDIAVQKQVGSNDKYLYVAAADGKAERRNVFTGRQKGKQIEITNGIEEGDEIIVAGISRLFDGTPIEVKND